MNTRRKLLIVLGATTLTPRLVFAQAKQAILIGWLHGGSLESSGHYLTAFQEGLTALGWKEGSQFVIEERWADGQSARLQSLAEELAAKNPMVIVAAPLQSVRAAAKAAPKTPIVIATGGDPVALGLVKSLARPGGLITGLTSLNASISEKYIELLVAAAPKVKRVGVLVGPSLRGRGFPREGVLRSAVQYSVEARFVEVVKAQDIEPAIARLEKEGAQALVVLASQTFIVEQQRVLKLALARQWPVIAGSGWAEAGALLSYNADNLANYRRAAYYVDRILKGAKPADLPIEQPTRFEFVVNLKTAKALGLTMPPEIMVRADRVIQ